MRPYSFISNYLQSSGWELVSLVGAHRRAPMFYKRVLGRTSVRPYMDQSVLETGLREGGS